MNCVGIEFASKGFNKIAPETKKKKKLHFIYCEFVV